VLSAEDDHGPARPPHPPLRHRRDRQRELALQEPRLIPLKVHSPPANQGGPYCTPIRGPVLEPIDSFFRLIEKLGETYALLGETYEYYVRPPEAVTASSR
jgi:hypothetical protein